MLAVASLLRRMNYSLMASTKNPDTSPGALTEELDTSAAPIQSNRHANGNGAKASEYSGSQIEILEGLEPVRIRPGMYICSTDSRGLHQLVREVVDNSVD